MKVFYKTLLLLCMFFPVSLWAQNNFFADKNESTFKKSTPQVRTIIPEKFRTISLDVNGLKQLLKTVPMEFTEAAQNKPVILSIPMPDGSISRFTIVESPIQERELMSKFSDIKTYSGQGIDDRTATIKIDWTSFGFHAQILSPISGSIYIDPYERGNVENYMSYSRKDLKPKARFNEEGIDVTGTNIPDFNARTLAGFCFGGQLRRYRFAVACTGEYAIAVAGSNPSAAAVHSAIVTTVNRVNGVYEKEVGIRLTLVENNNIIEYLNPSTDPFTGNNNANTLIGESQSVIINAIGSANFDIGHTFSTGGGGLAGLGVVCNNANKARGITGSSQPTGDAYDIDFVAHEVGHQFQGNHTFNSGTGGCGGNRSSSSAVEPGSGITIMGYAGLCGSSNDLANNSIPYFHALSQQQIGNFSNNSGSGGSCAQIINTGNNAPVVNAGTDYTIPAGTPFMLTGSATDANGDALTYSWEQYDIGSTTSNWNSGNSPFFRSFAPTTSPTRYFPQLSDILSGSQTIGEFLPTSTQTLNFRLTARDNRNGGAGACSDEMVLNVVAGTPFTVTSQTGTTNWTANGTNTADITWNPGNTANAPINATNVTILFSVDGGQTYPYTLVQSTPNDGSHTITIPAIATSSGKIMVRGANNVFFNINSGNVVITNSVCSAEGASIAPTTTVNAPVGSASLNLNLNPLYSTPLAPSGTLTSSNPQASLAVLNSNISSCQVYGGNIFRYTTHTFIVNQAAFYTFTLASNNGTVMSLYTGSYNPSSPCANFIASNTQVSGTALINPSVSGILVPNTTYVLAVGTFSATQPTLPSNYNITISSNPGGSAFQGTGIFVNPGSNFSYAYVIVDNTTNTIKAISTTANLSNASTFPIGSYTIYGLSYLTANANAINAFVNGNFSSLTSSLATQPGATCGNLSKNAVTVTINGAVPVVFTGLKARKVQNKVALDWGTLSEINASHFEIERSANGVEFTTIIGKVNARGNSSTETNYSIDDVNPIKGTGYYRVKQYDLDGKFTYSNVAAINFEKAASLLVVYPNPVKNTLNIEYTAIKGGKVEMNILDAKGSVIQQQVQTVIVGRNIHSMNVSNLAKGVYILKTIDADKNIVHTKFIKD